MKKPPVKIFVISAALAIAVFAYVFANRRMPACEGDGKYMSTAVECQQWGLDAAVCSAAVEKARKIVSDRAPKHETLFQCELRYSDCIEAEGGGFAPKPSFCLRGEGGNSDPVEVRYLQWESDRMNRRKTREVRID